MAHAVASATSNPSWARLLRKGWGLPAKVEIIRTTTGPVATVSTEEILMTRTSNSNTPNLTCCRWQMLAQAQTALSFFLTVSETPWLDGKHVVFGKVVEGTDVVDAVEALGSSTGRTNKSIIIADCGEEEA